MKQTVITLIVVICISTISIGCGSKIRYDLGNDEVPTKATYENGWFDTSSDFVRVSIAHMNFKAGMTLSNNGKVSNKSSLNSTLSIYSAKINEKSKKWEKDKLIVMIPVSAGVTIRYNLEDGDYIGVWSLIPDQEFQTTVRQGKLNSENLGWSFKITGK